jgi:ABC-type polar amino acid transport system ATPase subunit
MSVGENMEMSGTAPSATAPATGAPVVDVQGLVKSFDGRVVLDNVDLRVWPGKILSIIGQSGGGKTTLMRCINLLERPDRGRIEIAGETVFSGTRIVCRDLARLRQSVGMVFQRFHLFPHLTAIENIMLAQVKAGRASEDQALETAVRLLRRVHLAHRGLAFPEQMSGGEQQRVAIARALALQPKVLLFDEPTSALDPESTREVLRVMRELADDGMTMIIVSHEVPFARRISDWVVFIDGGVIVEQGPPADVLDRPAEARTRAFLTAFDEFPAAPGLAGR